MYACTYITYKCFTVSDKCIEIRIYVYNNRSSITTSILHKNFLSHFLIKFFNYVNFANGHVSLSLSKVAILRHYKTLTKLETHQC